MTIKISPSILTADLSNIGKTVGELEDAGADSLHLDVMDGHFVRNITFGPAFIRSIRKITKLPLEAHLMIEDPDMYIEQFAESGCDSIIIHRESHGNTLATLRRIKERGLKAGLALSPETGLKASMDLLPEIDMLLVMTVSPGFGGQAFIPECLAKVSEARRYFAGKGLEKEIGVDGGIKLDTGRLCIEAGADVLVAGTAIVDSGNIKEAVRRFKALP